MNKKLFLVIAIILCIGVGSFLLHAKNKKDDTPVQIQNEQKTKAAEEVNQKTTSFDKTKYSIDQPGSLWWVVNKKRPLPDRYAPTDLTTPNVTLRVPGNETMKVSKLVQPSLESLFAAMKAQNYSVYLSSGYRSYDYQVNLYNSYVAKDGQAAADRYSARPGTSEHQTGLAFDIGRTDGKCELEICFGDTSEGQWLKDHAHEYGFIIRYSSPEKEPITGYQYEPWHLRYVGVELATELHKTGQTMEEFFGLN